MNKMLLPKITFKEIIPDEKRIETAYARIFEMARRNILSKRQLTNGVSTKYNKIQYGKRIFDDQRGGQKNAS